MKRKIHNDLKPLLANLNRLNIEDYFNSDEFRNLLLENTDDEFWAKFRDSSGIMYLEEKNRTFVNCLNFLLIHWIDGKNTESASKHINRILKYVISGYIEFNEIPEDYTKLVQSLDFGPVTKETIKEIQIVIDEKKYSQIEMKKENLDTSVEEKFDYVIITALEDDEMEEILKNSDYGNAMDNEKYLVRKGSFKSNNSKKIIFVTQNYTGFVDSSILTTEIISKYNPKLIIMAGVLGGKPEETKIGDVIVANKVFTIDKGKIKDDLFLQEIESCNINNKYLNVIKSHKRKIIKYIEDEHSENKNVSIHFEPIACVRQVIDKLGFFGENFSKLDRKTLGVEMESYGVVRATELVNNGSTDVLVIKSVMDNTINKVDTNKKFAAYTSAKVVEYLFKENLV